MFFPFNNFVTYYYCDLHFVIHTIDNRNIYVKKNIPIVLKTTISDYTSVVLEPHLVNQFFEIGN